MGRRNSATAWALATWRSMRRARVSIPVMVRKAFRVRSDGPNRARPPRGLWCEGEVAEVLVELQAVVGGLRFGEGGEFPPGPVELSDSITAPPMELRGRRELGGGMHDNVGTQANGWHRYASRACYRRSAECRLRGRSRRLFEVDDDTAGLEADEALDKDRLAARGHGLAKKFSGSTGSTKWQVRRVS